MKPKQIAVFLGFTFTWSWAWWIYSLQTLESTQNSGITDKFVLLLLAGIYGPILSSIVTTVIFEGFGGLIQLLRRFTLWRAPAAVYATIFFLPIIVPLTGLLLYKYFYKPIGAFDSNGFQWVPIYLMAAWKFGPLGEELGWRGFLLPRLQNRYSPTISSLIVGLIWATWHVPLFWAPIGTAVSGEAVSARSVSFFYVFVICLSFIYSWVFNKANGSVLLTFLIHYLINAGLVFLFFPGVSAQIKIVSYFCLPGYLIFAIFCAEKMKGSREKDHGIQP